MSPPESRQYGCLERVTCPHCWETFPPERILWIAEHGDLLGDPMLGQQDQQRFLPTRFNVAGEALDARGFPCHALACPKCHLPVPRPMVELEPLFLSILGAPASGKSYFLASMTWQLRQTLSAAFAVSFSDADPALNQNLNDYEESLFLNPRANELCSLASLIRKTEEQGELYDTVSYGAQTVSYPRPFLFSMQPQSDHPNGAKAEQLGRVVCLYDNAGESFQPGKDAISSPVTRHMAHSRALLFVFDPTQDARFRNDMELGEKKFRQHDVQHRLTRQEPILQEAAARIRRYAKLRQTEKHHRPLIVVLTKYDMWSHLLTPLIGEEDSSEPWKPVGVGANGSGLNALDVTRIERYSGFCRRLMQKACPDIVAAAESFAKEVIYLPASAVGWCTRAARTDGQLYMRPAEAKPFWVTVPFLYALYRCHPGLIPTLKRKGETP
ncbi:hypothetical protein [Planctomicrobium sp. SH664]|uniref:hypothetical protein n=1 Tax=Planctomicrobium sp. SH664 TaxID=3448125 RepID=UPI003F5C805C